MKKLLLFMSMLFTLSVVCSANTIPLEQCASGGYQPVGQCPRNNNYGGGSTPTYSSGNRYRFIMPSIDGKSYYLVNLNTTDFDTAWNRYLTYMSTYKLSHEDMNRNEINLTIDSKGYYAWAISEDGQIFQGIASLGKKGSELKHINDQCKKVGAKNCKVILKLDGKKLELKDLINNTTTKLQVTYSF